MGIDPVTLYILTYFRVGNPTPADPRRKVADEIDLFEMAVQPEASKRPARGK